MDANELSETITNQVVAGIDAGAAEWVMPWQCLADAGPPISADGRPDRGTNALRLALPTDAGWASGLWARSADPRSTSSADAPAGRRSGLRRVVGA
jgi:antirestriction protein ArdC